MFTFDGEFAESFLLSGPGIMISKLVTGLFGQTFCIGRTSPPRPPHSNVDCREKQSCTREVNIALGGEGGMR